MELNLLCMNIHKGQGWYRNSTLDLLKTNIAKLRPDIIFFQEIIGSDVEKLIHEQWAHYSYGKNAVYLKKGYGNAILSKYPIIFSENFDISMHRFEHRGLLYSVAITPTHHRIHFLCVHLGLFKKGRQKQLEKIIHHIELHIPTNEPIIVAGDFNDWGSHATRPFINELQLAEAFLTMNGAYARTYPAWAPLLKLDRIYYRGIKVLSVQRLIGSFRKISDHIGLNGIFELV